MGDQTKEQLKQKQIDELIVSQMNAFRKEFLAFYNNFYAQKGVVLKPDAQYEIGPFELFVIEKLSLMKINAELNMARLEARVKELFNEFIDRVNESFAEEETDEANTDS